MLHSRDLADESRSLKNSFFYGKVINNNDPLKLRRCQIRISGLHKKIEDTDLPWAIQENHYGHGDAPGIGGYNIPCIGSDVLVTTMDETPYNLIYRGSVLLQTNIIEELLANYPNNICKIDRSGNLWTVNTDTDEVSLYHVSGSSFVVDGAGNLRVLIANQSNNINALKSNIPGVTVIMAGQCNIIASDAINISTSANITAIAGGNTTINSGGNTTINSGGNTTINSSGSASLNSTGFVTIRGSKITLQGGSISLNSGIGIGVPPASPIKVNKPNSRKRPVETKFTNKIDY